MCVCVLGGSSLCLFKPASWLLQSVWVLQQRPEGERVREDEVALIYGGEPVCRCGRLRGEDERQRVGGRREAGAEGSGRGCGPAGGRGAPLGPERGTGGRVAALGWRRGQQLGRLALGQPPERERRPGAGGRARDPPEGL